jgi:RecA/RadA recombinase
MGKPKGVNENNPILVRNRYGDWEDKTNEIAEYRLIQDGSLTEICFKSKPEQWYSYPKERVRQLGEVITTHNPTDMQLRVKGQLLLNVDAIAKYLDFYFVISKERRKPYAVSDVNVERNVAIDPACKIALDYFRSVAEVIGVQNEVDESLLTKQFSYFARVSDASVLAKYLAPEETLKALETERPLIYPFGTNVSQKIAVEKAFQSQAVIVQGPPGTGKTQTILNIIANAIRLGQTVAVVSNNNAATKNVADKLEEKGLGFLLAPLGRRENKDFFIGQQRAYPDWVKPSDEERVNLPHLESELKSLMASLDELIRANNDRAMLVSKIAQTQAEFELYQRHDGSSPSDGARLMLSQQSARDCLILQIECEETDLNSPLSLLRLIQEIFLYGFWGRKRRRKLFGEGAMALRSLYYEKYLSELQTRLSQLERILAENNFESIQQQMQDVSWALLRGVIAERFHSTKERPLFTNQELWTRYGDFLKEYPIVLSTTHSIKTSLSPHCLYDIIIVDESSQVDVATGVLALSCAKRAIIVGDEKQLPNVLSIDTAQRTQAIWNKYDLNCAAWNYAENSLLSSAKAIWPTAPNVLLKEHYRCHPKIAGFLNQKFYDNQLIVMTTDRDERDVMPVVFTAPGNHARGQINQRQAEVIQQEVAPTLLSAGVTDIGVITPYRDQVVMLKRTLGNEIEVDTVHGFQGREKQAIIMSTVDNQIRKFVDDPQLLNVAVSRAQLSFTVIMAEQKNNFSTNLRDLVRYINHQQQVVRHSQVRSVFDLLYADYTEARKQFLNKHGRTSEWDSESLAERVILNVLRSHEFSAMSLSCMRHVPLAWLIHDLSGLTERERQFTLHSSSHVDLLIYDSFGKLPLLAIEVDGWTFHQSGSLQSARDEIKNAIFQRSNLHLVRLSTTGSNEAAVIARALRKVVGDCDSDHSQRQ